MSWFLVESLFITNLILFVAPTKLYYKKMGSLFIMVALTSCLSFSIFSTIDVNYTLELQKTALNSVHISYTAPVYFSSDSLTSIFCFLTSLLTMVTYLSGWKNPAYSSPAFFFLLYFLCFFLFHTFTSINILSFYILFECTLVPMFLIVLIWGSRQRRFYAAYLFFFYTAAGSLLLLFGLFYFYFISDTTLTLTLNYLSVPIISQISLWVLFFIGFATKVPLVPLHTWLPEAHVEAPTVGSIILAGLLLKIGTFGMLKFMFPMLNDANFLFRPLAFFLAVLSIYHASLIAIRQTDLKKVIAYSSIAHMGFVISGLFTLNVYSLLGSIFIMFSHGIVASSLFFLIGALYERYKTKNLLEFGGLTTVIPVFSIFFFFLILANISFPGTSNFIGEFIVLIGLAETNIFITLLLTFSILLTAAYSIWTYNRLVFGSYNLNYFIGNSDLNKLEFFLSSILCFLFIFFGFNSEILFSKLEILTFGYLKVIKI